jgi:type IV pilus assembly protein PilA
MFRKFHAARSAESGLTLIELLVVIVVIGILAAISVPIYLNVRDQAKVGRLKSDVYASALSVSSYYKGRGTYPDATTFNSSVKVLSNGSNETIVFNNPSNQPQNQGNNDDVCVSGSATVSGTAYQFSYNLRAAKLVQGACTYVGQPAPEEPS